jgi:hypothetical protein
VRGLGNAAKTTPVDHEPLVKARGAGPSFHRLTGLPGGNQQVDVLMLIIINMMLYY